MVLRIVLADAGLTQRELAQWSGLSPKHISRLATGQAPFTAESALAIERATTLPAEVLLAVQLFAELRAARGE
jgi:plasmid maintenance system antidote protein VapI